MKTEYEKMLAGEVYSVVDQERLDMLNRTKDMCCEYNQIRPKLVRERNEMSHKILGRCDKQE